MEFLRHAPEGKYDAIIVDSSDPVGMPRLSFITSFSFNFNFLITLYILFLFYGVIYLSSPVPLIFFLDGHSRGLKTFLWVEYVMIFLVKNIKKMKLLWIVTLSH